MKNAFSSSKKLICLFILLTTSISFTWPQLLHSGHPIYNPLSDTIFVPEIIIRVNSFEELKKPGKEKAFKDDIFAVPVSVNINPEEYGVWYEFPKLNKKVWFLSIKAPQAQSINLILNPFNLLPGSKLFFYDSTRTRVLGAITFLNNKTSNILPLSIIRGNKIYCELQMPGYSEDYGYFTISQVSIEPRGDDNYKSTEDDWYGSSQSCNVNVNCKKSEAVQIQKNATIRILYRGTRRCTGTLINNLDNDGSPYVLTAAHCISTDYLASTVVVAFNYESPTCENTDVTPNTISGATLVAAGFHNPSEPDSLDFALIKLSESPPINYLPYYSGWDATGTVPGSTYVIHHPQGDIKKISGDSDQPNTSSLLTFDDNTHWLVANYEYGTSEAGSSGSGLIDDNNHLIGTLSAGGDACADDIYDYYQKFAESYNNYSDETYQLKKWLDPTQTGKLICSGLDAAGALKASAQTLSNIADSNSLSSMKNTTGWGYISGHNYQNNTLFAEHFTINGSKYLYGVNLIPSVAYSNSSSQQVNFFVREGGDIPGDLIYEQTIALNEIDAGYTYYIDFDSTLLVSNDFYFGYQISYNTDTFAVYTSSVTSAENTACTYLDGAWRPLQLDGGDYPSHLAVEVLAFDLMPEKGVISDTSDWADISIYPNPASDQIQIFIKAGDFGVVTCTLYDLSGRPMFSKNYYDQAINIPFPLNVETGLYILQVKLGNGESSSFKIIVN